MLIDEKTLKKSGYKNLESDTLTKAALAWAEKHKVFKYTNDYLGAYYKGDPETSEDWIFITDDGGFYKVFAEYMVWSNNYVKACWSYNWLLKTTKAIALGENPKTDPQYQS